MSNDGKATTRIAGAPVTETRGCDTFVAIAL
jgi:hypothetical protein